MGKCTTARGLDRLRRQMRWIPGTRGVRALLARAAYHLRAACPELVA